MNNTPNSSDLPDVRAVLFDLDGTLTNTLDDIANAMNYALAQFSLPPWPVDEYRYLVGNGAKILTRRAVRDRQDLADQVFPVYQRRYGAHSRDLTRPYPGIPDLLQRLTAENIPVCVFSNKPDADTRNVVSFYFPDISFSAVLGQTDRFPIKPDPAGALWIAENLGIAPEHFAYFGDTAVDMECAARAGMIPVGVLWGFRGEDELTSAGAKILLSRPEDFIPAKTEKDD